MNRVGKSPRALKWAAMGIILAASAVRAEDPLLGEIKAIKCVGCDPGKVTLVIHDPIDVRDFEVTIQNADYDKIVTPLPGKLVYERGDGCFYWDEKPKAGEADKKDSSKAAGRKPAPLGRAKKDSGAAGDSANGDDTGEAASAPEREIKPSRCIPYTKVAPPPKIGKQE